MEAVENSVGSTKVLGSAVEQKKPSASDYVLGTVATAFGGAMAGVATYQLVKADSTGQRLIWGGAVGVVGASPILMGISFFRGSQDDTITRRMQLGSLYLFASGSALAGAGVVVESLRTKETGRMYSGVPAATLGLGMLGFVAYLDIKDVREGKRGLLGELFSNLEVSPDSVSTAVRF